MNKDNLVNYIAEKADISKADARRAMDAFITGVTGALAAGDEVRLTGFGIFSVSTRAERTGRNPQTGESITLPESRAVKFKVGKELKNSVQ